MRQLILSYDTNITEAWKYGMPFYNYNGKMCAYLWVHKKLHQPYIGIVAGSIITDPDFIQEKRARMKILLIDPNKKHTRKKIKATLKQVVAFYAANM